MCQLIYNFRLIKMQKKSRKFNKIAQKILIFSVLINNYRYKTLTNKGLNEQYFSWEFPLFFQQNH